MIERDLEEQLEKLEGRNKLLEAQRLRQRTNFDLEMMREIGDCTGIDNSSRNLDGEAPVSRPTPR